MGSESRAPVQRPGFLSRMGPASTCCWVRMRKLGPGLAYAKDATLSTVERQDDVNPPTALQGERRCLTKRPRVLLWVLVSPARQRDGPEEPRKL